MCLPTNGQAATISSKAHLSLCYTVLIFGDSKSYLILATPTITFKSKPQNKDIEIHKYTKTFYQQNKCHSKVLNLIT